MSLKQLVLVSWLAAVLVALHFTFSFSAFARAQIQTFEFESIERSHHLSAGH